MKLIQAEAELDQNVDGHNVSSDEDDGEGEPHTSDVEFIDDDGDDGGDGDDQDDAPAKSKIEIMEKKVAAKAAQKTKKINNQPKQSGGRKKIPPPDLCDDDDGDENFYALNDDNDLEIKSTERISCPLCPSWIRIDYANETGKFYLMCQSGNCGVCYYDEATFRTYLVYARHEVLPKFKSPNRLLRCDCQIPARLIFLPYSNNDYLYRRLFFTCNQNTKQSGKQRCNFFRSADEEDEENEANLIAHYFKDSRKKKKKSKRANDAARYGLREEEETYKANKRAKESAEKKTIARGGGRGRGRGRGRGNGKK